MMGIEIKPTNERECTNVVPLVLCFALLVTAIAVVLVYKNNNDNLEATQHMAVITTEPTSIVTSPDPNSTIIQPPEASQESAVTSLTTLTINSLETTTTIMPVSTSTLQESEISTSTLQMSEMITSTSQSPKVQDTDEKTTIIPDPSKETPKIEINPSEQTTETTQTTTLAFTKTLQSEPIQTTTIQPENIVPTPNTPPPFEATTKSLEIPITMTTSTSAELSTQHELIPTPQSSKNIKRTKRNANFEETSSTIITTLSNSAPENLPTTTLAATLATVPLRAGDPTKKPENQFNFFESTTKGMDATTSTQSSLPTTSVGMETTTQGYLSFQTSIESTSEAPTTPIPTTNPTTPETTPTTKVQESYEIAWHLVASMSFVSLIFSYIFLLLFGRSAKSVIWIINAALVIFFCSFAGLSEMADYRIVAILSLITGLILLILMFWYRVMINAVAKFLKECCSVFVDVPGLKFEPIATIITVTISYIIFYKFFKSIPQDTNNEPHIFPLFIIIATFIWTTQFALSCQHFVVSGSVLRWYFNRDKTKVQKPIKASLFHLIRFHLGSACLGSFLIVLGKVFRILLFPFRTTEGKQGNFITNITSCCCIKPVKAFDEVTQYLAPRAYVFVAKDGMPFLKSGKQAYNLVSQRIMDIVALTHYGDISMFVCKILIAVISAVVGYPAIWMKTDQQYSRQLSLIIGGIFAFFVAHCVLMLIEITADTILVCFCIDCEENNGVSSSYFMSNELMKSIKDMKECVGGSLNFETGGMATGSSVPMLTHHGQKRNKKRKSSKLYD